MAKTNPIGVRFRQDVLDLLNTNHKIDSPQKALVFMERFYVQHHKLAQDITQVLRTEVKDLTKTTSVLKPQEQPKCNFSINTIPEQKEAPSAAQALIDAIKSEKIPKERDTPMGRKAWALEQQKRIQDIKNQLK